MPRQRTLNGFRKCDYRNPPIRRHRNGTPKRETFQLLNRADAIRRILEEHGLKSPLPTIKNHLAGEGYTVPSDGYILQVKKKLREELTLTTLEKQVLECERTARRLINLAGSRREALNYLRAA